MALICTMPMSSCCLKGIFRGGIGIFIGLGLARNWRGRSEHGDGKKNMIEVKHSHYTLTIYKTLRSKKYQKSWWTKKVHQTPGEVQEFRASQLKLNLHCRVFFFAEWPRLMTPGGSRGYGLNGLNHGYQMLLWMEEILPQLVDGLSHYDPIIYSVS